MNKQELATKIWATANELRKNIKASEYKDYILGFMFYKYLCDKEVDYLKDLGGEIDDLQDVDEDTKDKFKDGIGYFISYKNLFHVWKKAGVSLGAKDVSATFSLMITLSILSACHILMKIARCSERNSIS